MKKTFTLLLSSLFSLSLLAFDGSRLSITTARSNLNLKIEIDGQRVRMQGNHITLSNLSEGDHNLRVYREKRTEHFSNRFGPAYEIIYATSVYFGRDYQVEIFINGSGRVFVDSYRKDTDDESYTGIHSGASYDDVMSAREFGQVTGQIGKEWFEANKLISVKTIIGKNKFTTQQVKEMMYLFTFESNRLEVAKFAYCNTVDQQNYFRLYDALTFSSSKDELARFLREPR